MTFFPSPEQRVRDFLDSTLTTDIEHVLDPLDIRDVLEELEEHRSLLEQVDAAIEECETDQERVSRIRGVLGNHSGGNR